MFCAVGYVISVPSHLDDIENQKAMQLAKQVDPHGLRTIGT